MGDSVKKVLDKLEGVRETDSGWEALCPAHDDHNPSLSIMRGDKQPVVLKCHAGCAQDKVLSALMRCGVRARDLCSSKREPKAKPTATRATENRKRKGDPRKPTSSSGRCHRFYPTIDHFVDGQKRDPGDHRGNPTLAQRGPAWIYKDSTGTKNLMAVVRIQGMAGKSFMPFHPVKEGWRTGDPDGPLPLYNLHGPADEPDATVHVVEGEKDVETLKGLGFCATTSSHGSNSAKKSDWSPLAGRDAVVIPDNDDSGEKYARDVAQLLHALDPPARVRLLRLPGLKKKQDVSDYVAKMRKASRSDGNIARRLRTMVDIQAEDVEPDAEVVEATTGRLDPDDGKEGPDPHDLAKRVIDNHYRRGQILTLRFHHGQWWTWADGHYRMLPREELQANTNRDVRSVLEATLSVTQSRVVNVMRAMEGLCIVPGQLALPAWLGKRLRPGKGDLLAMENGLLDIEGVLAGDDDDLRDPTPEWFCPTRWDYPYEPRAKCPKWRGFLREVLPEPAERRLLQEYLGYCLVYDHQYQKFLVLVGRGANGKSVVTKVATELIGSANVTHVGLERFHQRFAMARTIGKLANIVGEIAARRDVAEDVLKEITSGDRIQVEHKFQMATDARPTVRLLFATNEAPHFADRSDAIWRRLLILPFDVTIPEHKQDRSLARDICATELPGIFNWAIEGLRRLRKSDGFTIPKSARRAIEEHRKESNPARRFLEELCECSADGETRTQEAFSAFQRWCGRQELRPGTEQQFGREVRSVYPEVQRKQKADSLGRRYFYIGLRMLPGAQF